jgi:hypothetical protein
MSAKQKLVATLFAAALMALGAFAVYYDVPLFPVSNPDAIVSVDTQPDAADHPLDVDNPIVDVLLPPDTTPPVDAPIQPVDVFIPPVDTSIPPVQPKGLVSSIEVLSKTVIPLDFTKFPQPLPKTPPTNAITTTGNTLVSTLSSAPAGSWIILTSNYSGGSIVLSKPVTITGLNKSITVNFTGSNGFEIASSNVAISNLTIVGGSSVAIYFGKAGENYVFSNLDIKNAAEGLALWFSGSINNLLLHDTTFSGYDLAAHCGTSAGCQNWRVENVKFLKSTGSGAGWGSDALAFEAGNNILVANVVVEGSNSDGIDIKAKNSVVYKVNVTNCMNNYIKLWKSSAIIESKVVFTGINSSLQTVIQIDGDNTSVEIKDTFITFKDGVTKCPAPILGEAANITLTLKNNTIGWPCGGPLELQTSGTLKLFDNKFFIANKAKEIIRIAGVDQCYPNDGAVCLDKFGSGNTYLTTKPSSL